MKESSARELASQSEAHEAALGELQSHLAKSKTQAEEALSAVASGSNAEEELRDQLAQTRVEAERRRVELEAVHAAHTTPGAGAFAELDEWGAVAAATAALQALGQPSTDSVAAALKESGFDDADAFFAALKAHDFGSFRRFGVDGAAVLACDAGASAAYNTAGESFHWFKGE